MADRRKGDRREPENGVVKIQFKQAIIYLIFAIILIISISANIVLTVKNRDYKERIEFYRNYPLEAGIYDEFTYDEDDDIYYELDEDEDFD